MAMAAGERRSETPVLLVTTMRDVAGDRGPLTVY